MPQVKLYKEARKRVKEIKGFYIHLLVYLLVLCLRFVFEEMGILSFKGSSFWGMGFWAVGLIAHGCSVFLPHMILGRNWKERKIRELIEKEKEVRKWQ